MKPGHGRRHRQGVLVPSFHAGPPSPRSRLTVCKFPASAVTQECERMIVLCVWRLPIAGKTAARTGHHTLDSRSHEILVHRKLEGSISHVPTKVAWPECLGSSARSPRNFAHSHLAPSLKPSERKLTRPPAGLSYNKQLDCRLCFLRPHISCRHRIKPDGRH